MAPLSSPTSQPGAKSNGYSTPYGGWAGIGADPPPAIVRPIARYARSSKVSSGPGVDIATTEPMTKTRPDEATTAMRRRDIPPAT